ncbi:MAG TPA: ankyrin repeat domain-containing protein [Thermoanaerobaculia bacterium]|nr:ankyrin repeat domain-containing protein [Thermoanaerobaculia bacterium]
MSAALAVKATLAVFVALSIVVTLRRSRASLRHLVLGASFAFLLLLPLVQRFAPRWLIPVEDAKAPAMLIERQTEMRFDDFAPAAALPRRTPIPWTTLYAAGSTLLLAWLALGILRLQKVARDGEVWLEGTARLNEIALGENIRRSALVVLSGDVSSPMTFGLRRSTILLPFAARDWSHDALTRALRHELEHVRREDWLQQLIARAAVAVYWLHPLVWIAWRRFCLEAERACDDAVVDSCAAPDVYAGQLVALARDVRRMHALPALGMASRSRLAVRVSSILDATQLRGRHSRAAATATLVVALALLVSLAPVQLVAAAAQVVVPMDGDHPYEQPPTEALIQAAQAGDVEKVRSLLDSGVDVNSILLGDGTALIAAVRGGQQPMIDFLIDRGADVNLGVRGDGNPLIAAAREGSADAVRELLDRGATIDAVVPEDESPLIQAAAEGHAEVVRLLIDRGADVNQSAIANGNELRTPLGMARRGGFREIEEMLMRAGARR